MIVLGLIVLALIVALRLLSPARPVYFSRPNGYYERTAEEVAEYERTEALIQKCMAERGVYRESRRPALRAVNHATDEVWVEWPSGLVERMPRSEMLARDIRPRLDR